MSQLPVSSTCRLAFRSYVSGTALRRLAGSRAAALTASAALFTVRHCSTVPTEEEVIKAYKVLGVSTTVSFADVKKKYVDLAKEHHPDIAAASPTSSSSTAAGANNRMVDINNAYSTVNRFHKAGRKLSSHHHDTARSGQPGGMGGYSPSGGASSYWHAGHHQQHPQHNYYTTQDQGYQPWHEDLDPLLYEMMWEELRRQNDRDAFERDMHRADNFDGFAREDAAPNFGGGSYRPPRQQRSRQPPHPNGNSATESGKKKEKVKTTTWGEADLQALVNMYQDGKSFEFISNALGKEVGKVVEEFNRWSDDKKKNSRRPHRQGNQRSARRGSNKSYIHKGPSGGPFYHMEYPDGPPYGFYNYMIHDDDDDPDGDWDGDDSSDPYGYYAGEDYGYYDDPWQAEEDEPRPFNGTHRMSGAPGGAQHTYKGPATSRQGSRGAGQGNNNNNSSRRPKRDKFGKNSGNRTFHNRNKRS